MILITAVPWKKGEVRIHGAGIIWYREAANPKKGPLGDHATVTLSVSQEGEGLKEISKDG